ncbi:MAG: hypothetical protein AB7X49_27220, partial [Geminicoccaceae bacterium]
MQVTTIAANDVSGSASPGTIRGSYPRLSGSPPPASDLAPAEADSFYADSLRLLHASGIPV